MTTVTMGIHALVLAPHPNNESVGCGRRLCQHLERGGMGPVSFLTSSERGRHSYSEAETITTNS